MKPAGSGPLLQTRQTPVELELQVFGHLNFKVPVWVRSFPIL